MNEENSVHSNDSRDTSLQAEQDKRKTGRYLREDRAAKTKQRRRNQRIRIATGIAALVLLALIVVLCVKVFGGDGFKGTWDLDGTTAYQFNGSGKGAMLLPSASYEFSYTVDKENQTIHIDFADEKANDYTYTYELTGSKLVLSGGDEDETFAYEFKKQ